jgi:hypothetical protein
MRGAHAAAVAYTSHLKIYNIDIYIGSMISSAYTSCVEKTVDVDSRGGTRVHVSCLEEENWKVEVHREKEWQYGARDGNGKSKSARARFDAHIRRRKKVLETRAATAPRHFYPLCV